MKRRRDKEKAMAYFVMADASRRGLRNSKIFGVGAACVWSDDVLRDAFTCAGDYMKSDPQPSNAMLEANMRAGSVVFFSYEVNAMMVGDISSSMANYLDKLARRFEKQSEGQFANNPENYEDICRF